MDPRPRTPKGLVEHFRSARWGLIFGLWLLAGAFGISKSYIYTLTAGIPAPGMRVNLLEMTSMVVWALITPVIFWLCERYVIDRTTWRRHLWRHGLWSLGLAFLDSTAQELVGKYLIHFPVPSLPLLFIKKSFINVFSYFAVAALAHARSYQRLHAERQLRASELETELVKAQMQALKMQLTPHFLFNTLHTVSALICTQQNQRAMSMIAGLGDLLRTVLRSEGVHEITLRQELAFIEQYLRVEQIRFEDRLRVELDVESEVLDALVPHLVLQPLVENSIRHGIEASSAPGTVEIRAWQDEGSMLWLSVRDSGTGQAPEAETLERSGIGLANTRARLDRLYGPRHHLEFAPLPGRGAVAKLALPLHWQPFEASPQHDGRASAHAHPSADR